MDAVCYPALTAFFDKFDTAPTSLSGVKDGMRAISELELTARLHVPFGQGSVAGILIGNVSKNDVADQAIGAILRRRVVIGSGKSNVSRRLMPSSRVGAMPPPAGLLLSGQQVIQRGIVEH
ncbi:hypothetical protein KDW41_24780 [Burkholderia vietnamiensis]|nr:hypothetical protein [Burkholderia vietnamiensis]